MSTVSEPMLYVNVANNCKNGYITFYGFPDTWSPDPVEHGAPPVVMPTIKNDGNVYQALMVSSGSDADEGSNETQGEVYFNMPNGSQLAITWHIYGHTETNPDEGNLAISCTGYTVEYLQADGTYSADVYWAVSEVNIFTSTIQITEE